MKKLLIACSIILFSISSYSQNLEQEKKNLNKIVLNQTGSGLTQTQISQLMSDWKKFQLDYGEFPSVPFNEVTNEVEFVFNREFQLDKKIIFNRILEWSAINFGSLDKVLHYQNLESGKIILKGMFSFNHREDFQNFWGTKKETIDSKDCYQTYIFTIKDNKLKIQVTDIVLEYELGGQITPTVYVPIKKYRFPLTNLYPITNFESIKWKENLDILNEVNLRILSMDKNLKEYINDYQNDYSF